MGKLKYLCLSDIHLGEDASLLNDKKGLKTLGSYLKEIAPDGVKNIILGGDITDAVLASKKEYALKTKAFISCLSDNINEIGKVTFLFGNHDLSLFRELICNGSSMSKFFLHGVSSDNNTDVQNLKEILVDANTDIRFQIANPLYITQSEKRVYIFHHGHHLRYDIHNGWNLFKFGDKTRVIQKITGNDLEFGRPSPGRAGTLEEFENSTFPFVTTLWKNEYDETVPGEEQFWRGVHKVSKQFNKRIIEPKLHQLHNNDLDEINKFSRELVFQEYIPAILKSSLVSVEDGKEISFIYGDTHDGGYSTDNVSNRKVQIYNTGAWISYDDNHHPHCLIYTADENDNEKMYECGFDSDYIAERGAKMKDVKKPKLGILKHIWGK